MGKWNAGSVKALMEQRFEALDKALVLQAAEYARRLDELNHAYEREQRSLQTYLPRDAYEIRHAELEKQIAVVEEVIQAIQTVDNANEKWASVRRTDIMILSYVILAVAAVAAVIVPLLLR